MGKAIRFQGEKCAEAISQPSTVRFGLVGDYNSHDHISAKRPQEKSVKIKGAQEEQIQIEGEEEKPVPIKRAEEKQVQVKGSRQIQIQGSQEKPIQVQGPKEEPIQVQGSEEESVAVKGAPQGQEAETIQGEGQAIAIQGAIVPETIPQPTAVGVDVFDDHDGVAQRSPTLPILI